MGRTFTRRVTWGQALRIQVHDAGGLKPATERIRRVVGDWPGSRNTFAKLFTSTAPPKEGADALRAWLLLCAVGETPEEWGVSDAKLPTGFDTKEVCDLLKPSSGWSTADEDFAESWFQPAVNRTELLVTSP